MSKNFENKAMENKEDEAMENANVSENIGTAEYQQAEDVASKTADQEEVANIHAENDKSKDASPANGSSENETPVKIIEIDSLKEQVARHIGNMGMDFEIIKNLNTDDYGVKVTGCGKALTYPSISEFISHASKDFINRGVFMSPDEFEEIVKMILDKIKKSEYKYCHEEIGYENSRFYFDLVYEKNKNIASTYQGLAPINQQLTCENFDDYISQLETDILCKPKAAIIVLTALTGFYNNIIGRNNNNIVLDIYGDTSHGKTTLLNIACSLFGCPEDLMISNNTTECRLVAQAENNVFISNCIDDVLRGGTKQMLDLIFGLADGSGRSTMNRKGKPFYGATVMTSERSVFDVMDSSEARGQIYRMIELEVEGMDLADDGDHAQAILDIAFNNYGVIAPKFGQFILRNYSAEDIKNMVASTKNRIKEDHVSMVSHDRMVCKIAIIRVIGEIFNECFGTHINLNQIVSILVKAFFDGLRKVNTKNNLYTMIWKLFDMDCQKNTCERIFADNATSYDPMVHFGFCNANNYDDIFIQTTRLFALANGMSPEEIILKEKELRAEGKTTLMPKDFTGGHPSVTESMFKSTLREWAKKNWLHPGEKGKRLARKMTAVQSDLSADKMMYNIMR